MVGEIIQLTGEQENAIDFLIKNIRAGVIALAGPAGTGKTTVIKQLVARLEGQVTVCATTNKAAVVLRKKGLDAVTLHQACMTPLFKPPLDKVGSFLNTASEKNTKYPEELLDSYTHEELFDALMATKRSGICSGMRSLGIRDMFAYVSGWLPAGKKEGILIVDEASMLGEKDLDIVMQVFDYIILVGDEYQLSPVKATPVFWNVPTRIALKQIHRQAEGSQPLQIATKIRTKQPLMMAPRQKIDYELAREGMPVIVWKNTTRERLTIQIRENLGYAGLPPQPGEYLICRNAQDRDAKERGLYNNSLWKVLACNENYCCTLENESGEVVEDEYVFIEELNKGDGLPFRFGYCLTAHNSQGSEWPTVMVHASDAGAHLAAFPEEGRKWLYTAVTRGKENVVWVA